jgi:hypothetical protein
MANQTYETPVEGASMTTEYSKNKNAKVPGSGVYRHPESGQEAIVQSDPLWGNTQAQAFARLGFKFVREAKQSEIQTLPEMAAEARSADADTNKGILARLNALEGVAEDNKSLSQEVAELKEKLAAEEKARKDAEEQIAEAGRKAVSAGEAQSKENAKASAAANTVEREHATGTTNREVQSATNAQGKAPVKEGK